MGRIVLRLTDCLKKGKSPHVLLTSAEFIEEGTIRTRGVHSFLVGGGGVRQQFLWAGSRAARINLTITGIPNH